MVIGLIFSTGIVVIACVVLYIILTKHLNSAITQMNTSIATLDTRITDLANQMSGTYVPTTQYIPTSQKVSTLQTQLGVVQETLQYQENQIMQNANSIQKGNIPLKAVTFS